MHLVVRPEASLAGVGAGFGWAVCRSTQARVRGGELEGATIRGETQEQLISRGTFLQPVGHSRLLTEANEWKIRNNADPM